ncbi:OsmC family protein [Gemmatirosa kalamazoonensis]|uniref:OsmC family protein n=1 Tax=Gemmatirosa kalamazoonensis TaxID=861299 RepID=W0RGP4_9BACT|nr:OsmC family protein [Gemmatirosa kalamazoonensis]AHG90259.1 OsmC family protein [Gemmatirosa kalamazoonensis]
MGVPPDPAAAATPDRGTVVARNAGPGFTTTLTAGAHALVVDEPVAAGGADEGATPYDLLLGAVGACTAITVRMYARRKGWPLEDVVVRVRAGGRSHAADCAECVDRAVSAPAVVSEVELHGPLSDEQRARLRYIAGRCPVKQVLRGGLSVIDAE